MASNRLFLLRKSRQRRVPAPRAQRPQRSKGSTAWTTAVRHRGFLFSGCSRVAPEQADPAGPTATGYSKPAPRTDQVLGPLAERRNTVFSDPTLAGVGEAQGKSVGQVTLRWPPRPAND